MRYALWVEALDRDGNRARMRVHTGSMATGSTLLATANTVKSAIDGISDATITKIWSVWSDSDLEVGEPAPSGINELSALFITSDSDGNIYTNIIPAIKDSAIATSGPMAGVVLSAEAIDLIRGILQSVPVLSNQLALVQTDEILAARVS